MKEGQESTFRPEVTVACPFCGGTVFYGRSQDEGAIQADPCLVHTMPYCEKFDELSIADFMTAVRKHLQAQRN
jgi:hypothetical protein